MTKFYSEALRYSLCLLAFSIPFSKALLSIALGLAVVFFILKKTSSSIHIHSLITDTPLNKAILFFLIYCLVSLAWGSHPAINLQGLSKFFRSYLIIFLVLDAFKTPQSMKPLLLSLCLGAMLVSLLVISQFGIEFSISKWVSDTSLIRRVSATFSNPTSLSAYFALILPLALLLLENKKSRSHILLTLATLSVILLAFYICYSRNILFFLILSTCFIFLVFNKKILLFPKIIILSSVILIIASTLFIKFNKNVSLWERFYLWKISMQMVKDRPLLGHGLNSYSQINKYYFPVHRKDMPYSSGAYLYLAYPHNSYLKLWVEIGLIGLLLYLYVYYCFFRYAFQVQSRSQGRDRFRLNLYLISIMTLLTSTFFDTFLEGTQTRSAFWLIMGLMMVELRGLAQTTESGQVSEVVPETNASKDLVDVLQT